MTDQQPGKGAEVTPKGAVEVNEEDLDRAAGGASGGDLPSESLSLNFSKIETAANKFGDGAKPNKFFAYDPGIIQKKI
jgi:hypothetical protein